MKGALRDMQSQRLYWWNLFLLSPDVSGWVQAGTGDETLEACYGTDGYRAAFGKVHGPRTQLHKTGFLWYQRPSTWEHFVHKVVSGLRLPVSRTVRFQHRNREWKWADGKAKQFSFVYYKMYHKRLSPFLQSVPCSVACILLHWVLAFAQAKRCPDWLRAFRFHKSEQELTIKQQKQSQCLSFPNCRG